MKASVDETGLEDALGALRKLQGAAPDRALSQALNNVAKDTLSPLQAETASVFERPTPFTLNAFRVDYARPQSLSAAVSVKDTKSGSARGKAPEDWFGPQVYGGERQLKASERFLRARGILPAGRYAVPGPGARLDAYGNMSRGHISQLMKGLHAAAQPGSDERPAFFVMRRGKQPIGIGERLAHGLGSRARIALVLIFVSEPRYTARFDFHGVAQEVAEDEALFASYIDQALAAALR